MWEFIQDQLFGMKWLNDIIGFLLSSFGVNTESAVVSAIRFFLYDVIKIVLLLCILVFVISFIQSYFPPERSKKIMGRFHGIGANIVGALLGTVTPFCSCSSIPIFMGFTSAGLPLGVTFSFLISSPMVAPGFIYTGMTKRSFDNEEIRKQSETLIPEGRLGQPEDISKVVLFLLSDLSDYINGTNVFADGGYHIQK